jgi:hypothetical protein
VAHGGTCTRAIDHVFLRTLDKNEIAGIQEGMEVFLAAEPQGKLTTVWGDIKRQ